MTKPPRPVPHLSPRESAELLGVTPRTFERYVSRGLIDPALRLPTGHRRFARRAVLALVKVDPDQLTLAEADR